MSWLDRFRSKPDQPAGDCAEKHVGPFVDYGRKRRCENCGAVWIRR